MFVLCCISSLDRTSRKVQYHSRSLLTVTLVLFDVLVAFRLPFWMVRLLHLWVLLVCPNFSNAKPIFSRHQPSNQVFNNKNQLNMLVGKHLCSSHQLKMLDVYSKQVLIQQCLLNSLTISSHNLLCSFTTRYEYYAISCQ